MLTEDKTLIIQLEFEKKAMKLVEDSEKRYNMMLTISPRDISLPIAIGTLNMTAKAAREGLIDYWVSSRISSNFYHTTSTSPQNGIN